MNAQPGSDPSDAGDHSSGIQRTGLLALLFTDIVGSTQIKETLGDRDGVALIQRHNALVREVLGKFPDGQEISTAGDSFFIAFTKPSEAVHFALIVQSRLRQLKGETKAEIQDRIGMHLGEVVIEAEAAGPKYKDLHGIQIDTCSRVMSLAEAGQILMTRAVFDNARQVLKGQGNEGIGRLEWLSHGPYVLKGIEEPVEICEVSEAGTKPAAVPVTSEKARRYISEDTEEVLGWRPAVEEIVPGTKWVLERKLGEGGFGEVWLGRHPTTKDRRVFKFCFRADRVRSLKREMTLFRVLKERVGEHPNIVALRDVFFDEPPFYVEMDHVDGADLRGWCDQLGGPGHVPLETRLEVVAQVADAIDAAHRAGVIHRDIKPANILVSRFPAPNGQPLAKLTDFGIGKVVSAEFLEGVTRLGFTQTMISDGTSSQTGTQMYMAPELLAGQPATPASDIYSLGVVLYQLVAEDLSRPLTTDWAKRVADPFLREDLERCFAGDPQERFASAGLLAENLRSLGLRHAEEFARKAGVRRRKVRILATVASVVIVLPLLVWGLLKWRDVRGGGSVVRNLGAVYAKVRTYQDQTEMKQEVTMGGGKQNIEFTSSIFFAKPNKINITMKISIQEVRVVCDGQRLWTYYSIGKTKQYKESAAPKTLSSALERELSDDPFVCGILHAFNLYAIVSNDDPAGAFSSRAKNLKLLGSEDVDGKHAFVLRWDELERIPVLLREPGETNVTDYPTPTKVWVSKRDGLVLRMSKDVILVTKAEARIQSLGRASKAIENISQFLLTETHTNIRLDEPIPDSTFTFTPPAGAKKVDKFSIWLAMAGLPDTPAPPRSKADLAKMIPPRNPAAKPELIDLSDSYNESLTGFLAESEDNDLKTLPRGLQTLAGVQFDVRGVVYLPSRATRYKAAYPQQVQGIKVNRKALRLHFLHSSHMGDATNGTVIARYILNYADGEKRELPVAYGRDIVDWWKQGDPGPFTATIAWTGTNKAASARGASIQLCKSTFANPRPEVTIETMDFISAMQTPSPFLIALTVE